MADLLPPDPHDSIPLVVAALGPIEPGLTGMEPFRYLPHSVFVGTRGLGAFEESMTALYEITRRFTSEFGIRPFLEHEPDATLAQLRAWARDPDPRVRRLVSEGTRPRLPWAPRLPAFVADPAPVLELLELLRDDPSEDVRRSVANSLNDISKDHPELVVKVAARWWADGSPERRRLVRQALRTLVKRADSGALAVLGLAAADHLELVAASIDPPDPVIGQRVRIEVGVADRRDHGGPQQVAVDVLVHFVRSTGTTHRVFKAGVRELRPGETGTFACAVSLAQHSTRKHYAGVHRVQAQVNGQRTDLGTFTLRER